MTIYLIINRKTRFFYVGQTEKTVQERLYQHIKSARSGADGLLYDAIRYYGEENFVALKLEDTTKGKALAREKFYIEYFNTFGEHAMGYNMNAGGAGRAAQVPGKMPLGISWYCVEEDRYFRTTKDAADWLIESKGLNIKQSSAAKAIGHAGRRGLMYRGYSWERHQNS